MTNDAKPRVRPSSLLDNAARRLVAAQLRKLRHGRLIIIERGRCHEFGQPGAALAATVELHASRFYRRLITGGDLGAAESLMDGDWTCDDLTALVRIFIRNIRPNSGLLFGWARLRIMLARIRHALRRNTRRGSRRNIRSHYDLGNDFFKLFLDESLTYSCGIFEDNWQSMQEASLAKIERACRALALGPEDHLLEIGGGWGSLAIHAANQYGCRVTTTTVSHAQWQCMTERVQAAGLSSRVTVLSQDYRDLNGQFDKLVSIEMVEAVGQQYLGKYFRKCASLLKPSGLMLLQGIVIADHCYADYCHNVDFINHYIFPGGRLPSVAGLLQSMAAATDMRCIYLEDFAPHYAETLRRWRSEFLKHLADARRMGFDERFLRMWDYYFCYCEAGFEERRVNVVQMLLARPDARRTILDCAPADRASFATASGTYAQTIL